MSDRDWNRRHDRQQQWDDERDRDRPHRSGGYFQGEPGQGNNPGRFPIERDGPRPDRSDSWRGHADRDAEHRARQQERGWDRDDHRGRSGWQEERDMGRAMGHGLGRNHDEHLHGYSGRGYDGLSDRRYDERGPGRVFDRGEDYGRADTHARGRAGQGSHDPGRHDRHDRGFMDRAGDEVSSWFGDDDAERRRRMDEREDRYRNERQGRTRRDW